MRLPLTVLAGYFLWREWQALEMAQGWLRVMAHVATMLFLALIAAMTLARRRPLRKSDGWLPRLAALANLARAGSREHWVSDTVAGSLLGYALGSLAWEARRDSRQGKNAPKIAVGMDSVSVAWDF